MHEKRSFYVHHTCDACPQISARKRGTEAHEPYDLLMRDTAEALMAATSQLLSAPDAELDYEGDLEEYGKRLCATMVAFGEGHFKCLQGLDKKYLFLNEV